MAKFQVIVSNIGTVTDTDNGFLANRDYLQYVRLSKDNYGRAAGEDVTLMMDGEIANEYFGSSNSEE